MEKQTKYAKDKERLLKKLLDRLEKKPQPQKKPKTDVKRGQTA